MMKRGERWRVIRGSRCSGVGGAEGSRGIASCQLVLVSVLFFFFFFFFHITREIASAAVHLSASG